jgi:hypothetical protein
MVDSMRPIFLLLFGVAVITLISCASHHGGRNATSRRALASYSGLTLRTKMPATTPSGIAFTCEVPSQVSVRQDRLISKEPSFELQIAVMHNSAKLRSDFEETRRLANGSSQVYVVPLEDVECGPFVGFITYEESAPKKGVTMSAYFESESFQVIWYGAMSSHSEPTAKSIEQAISCVLKSIAKS